jgi:flavin-dependent dehydrogenase
LIPVRHPLELFVGNHYVAIGDSACMNIPINGSGIENAMLAGKILAEELLKIGVTDYSIEKLWSYQYRYYQEIGAKMTSLDIIKYFLFSVTPAEVNYIIERKLLKATDFETSLLGKELKIEVSDLLGRLARGFSRLDLLLSLKIAVDSSTTVLAIAQAIPEKYDEKTWQDWSQKIIKQFAPYKKKIKN